MEIYYSKETLYIELNDSISFTLISKLKRKMYHILDIYKIYNIELKIIDNNYDKSLIEELIKEYKNKYNGTIIVK